jgi:NAD(P)-dependent dehydrogenase (short-subunit alcohol dehydrogenase family)
LTAPNVDLTGKVALVTGATGGIGKEIARGLVRAGAIVMIGGRDPGRGEAARAELAAEPAPGGTRASVALMRLDVADQASIHTFGRAFAERYSALHLLVNNAGAWFTDRRVSPDGVELTFATNVLGPHLLTEVLLDRLRAAGRARVVNIVSGIAGSYDATDLQFERRPYQGYRAYAQSKQALRMLTWGLADRVAGTGITANAAAPGFVRTELNRNARGVATTMINLMARVFGDSPAKGARTPLWVATDPALANATGRYYDRHKEKDGKFHDPDAIADLERRCRELAPLRRS